MGKNPTAGWRLFLFALLLGGFLSGAAAGDTLVFRAWRDGLPLSGLRLEDLALRVNGSACEITGLEEVRQKLADSSASRPRLVTLVFNIGDFKLDLAPAVEFVFAKVLRPNDRLLVYSNNFFLADHVVTSPESEKKRLLQILAIEKRKYKVLYQSARFQMTDLLNSTARLMGGQTTPEAGFQEPEAGNRQGVYPEAIRRNFIHIMVQTVQAYRKFFLNLGDDRLRRLAGYLCGQDAEKWGFVFYEKPTFYVPEPQSLLAEYLSPSDLFKKMYQELHVADALNVAAIGKSFVGGGTWSTLLLTPSDRIPLAVSSEKGTLRLDRSRIASEGERVFPQISRSNGGVFEDGSKIEPFAAKTEGSEDRFYRLTYAAPATPFREVTLTASVPCELVYNDQRHPVPPAAPAPGATPRIAEVEVIESQLRIRMELQPPVAGALPRKIRVSVQLSNEKMNMVLDRIMEAIVNTEATFVEVPLPNLSKGGYDLVAEAIDADTRQNDLALLSFKITKKGIQILAGMKI